MAQYLRIHPDNPQGRLVRQAVEIVLGGGVIAYPTDSAYALGCRIGNRNALERIRRIRDLGPRHLFTLACRDLSEVSTYARIDNPAYRLLRTHTPGAYTFILPGTKDVPRRLMDARQKTIGLRVPDHRLAQALLAALAEPLMTTTLILPGHTQALSDPETIRERLGAEIDVIIDGGLGGLEATTMVDLTGPAPRVVRHGRGDASPFE